MTRYERDKIEARSRMMLKLHGIQHTPRRATRASNEGTAEALLWAAATIISATDDISPDPEVVGVLVDRMWLVADEWVKERQTQLGRPAKGTLHGEQARERKDGE